MRTHSLTLILLVMWGQSFHAQQSAPSLPPPAGITVDYEQHVKPILASKCFGCHGPTQQQSGLRLDLRQNALRGGDYGTVIVPGKSAESKLILRLTGSVVGLQMPPTGPLSPDDIGVLRAWIDQGADMPGRANEAAAVVRTTEPRIQALIDTIHRRATAGVRKAVLADPSLARAADANGSSMLMHATYAGTLDTMRALIEAGADVRARNDRRATALHWAATDAAKLRLLLSHGADINASTVEGRTVLHTAALQPAGEALVRSLVEADADVNAKTITGQTPLFMAVGANLESARLLIDKGADPNARSGTGTTPLMVAGVPGAVALLVSRGADVDVKGKKSETAIANAAAVGDLDGVKVLLQKGVAVNVPDYRGYTPLMLAAHNDRGQPDIVKLLLAHGADPSATGEDETALSLAAKRGESDVTRLLRDAQAAGARPTSTAGKR